MKQKFTSNGWLVVNKPEGVESFGVIRKLKFRYQFHKIGFAGTLDPLASGILLIGINKATKLIPQVHLAKKKYEVQIRFGAITPTLDSEGRYASLEPVSHNPSTRIHHIKKYIGSYQQKIPNFSAHKKEGKNFYQLARNNEAIEERYKQVAISSLKILYSKPTTLGIELECQTGFYVRAFAEELSSSLGDLGYASYIKRLNIGDFSMSRSVAYEKILDFSSIDDLSNYLITI
ncbi:tRNA pseudouridine(55) synthase TruB [Alphaproteobacteria bacterium]|nr:tRNA pseudouridine(55) synthase TruB [Alphaproteobacteria bacterium]